MLIFSFENSTNWHSISPKISRIFYLDLIPVTIKEIFSFSIKISNKGVSIGIIHAVISDSKHIFGDSNLSNFIEGVSSQIIFERTIFRVQIVFLVQKNRVVIFVWICNCERFAFRSYQVQVNARSWLVQNVLLVWCQVNPLWRWIYWLLSGCFSCWL